MQKAWIQWGVAGATAIVAVLLGAPLKAQDNAGIRPVAEELDKRTKPAETDEGGALKDKLSDSAVRVMATFAWSIMPDEVPDASGKLVKLDKTDPQKFFIPIEDARRVIKVATRSAYAEACDLADLEKANYQTLIRSEANRRIWSAQQLLFINSLHMFSVSYFTGNISMTEEKDGAAKKPAAGAEASDSAAPEGGAAAAAQGGAAYVAPKKLSCSPEQKEKVKQSIKAYVEAAGVAEVPGQPAPQAPKPATKQATQPAPVAGGAN
jgi:hypothetical protein